MKGGSRSYDVSRRFGCNERTIYRLQQRVLQTGSVNDRPRPGRPRITTPREDRYMMTSSHSQCFIPATKICSVSDRLRGPESLFILSGTDSGPLGYELNDHTGVSLTQHHRVSRLDWLRQHNRWVSQQDNHAVIILFTLVTSWRPTTLTRSNGLPDHQICHLYM